MTGLLAKVGRKAVYLKDQQRLLAEERSRRRKARARGVSGTPIGSYPVKPEPHAVMRMIAAELGREITTSQSSAAACIWWANRTTREPDARLLQLSTKIPVLNVACRSIEKSHITRAYDEVFGRSLAIDPSTHIGPALEKPEQNASHSGRIVACPTDRRLGYAYQKPVNNRVGDAVEDIRIPVFKDKIPFVYFKYRPVSDRYSNTNTDVRLAETSEALTDEEQALVIELCGRLGLDYGELDGLRDRDDGGLYIVDVNQTPWGPPNHLPPADREKAIRELATAFSDAFLTT